jgi:hypothetical protein
MGYMCYRKISRQIKAAAYQSVNKMLLHYLVVSGVKQLLIPYVTYANYFLKWSKTNDKKKVQFIILLKVFNNLTENCISTVASSKLSLQCSDLLCDNKQKIFLLTFVAAK